MCIKQTVMRIQIEPDTYLFLEGGFQFALKMINKFSDPAVIPVIFLPVADEDVILISRDKAGHLINSFYQS